MNTPLIFFGNSTLSVPVLDILLANSLSPELIVTSPDRPAGRHLQLVPNPVKSFALAHGIPTAASVDIPITNHIGLVAAYGRIIKPPVLELFSGRLYNLHPSLLPLYRGPSPLQFQILDKVKTTGVTLIGIDESVDHGPVFGQIPDVVLADDSATTLGLRLFSRGADMFVDFLAHPEKYPPAPQDHSRATFTRLLTREDGFIPYPVFVSGLNSNSEEIFTKFRAFSPWPGVWTTNPSGKRLKLAAVKPQILVQIEGKSPMPWPL